MTKSLLLFKQKVDQLHTYFFPQTHSISIHHSPINSTTLFYIRLVSLLYLTSIYIWSITTTGSALNNIIYLTMQGYYMTWLYFLLCMQDFMVNGLGRWGRVFPLSNNLKYYIEIAYEIAFCVQLPITIIFWGFLFKLILEMDVSIEVIIVNANLHAGPFIVLCLDMAYNSFSFPQQHFYIVLLFGFLYAIVNLSYSLAAHIIYQPIDWVSILSYALMVGAVVMTFFMHWLGRYIYRKFKKEKMDSQMMEGLLPKGKDSQSSEKSDKGGKVDTAIGKQVSNNQEIVSIGTADGENKLDSSLISENL